MNTVSSGPESKVRPKRLRWIILVSLLAVIGAGYAAARLYEFADPANSDPTALPSSKRNAPFITTPDAIVNKMIEVGEISSDDLVYDLGCGDGRIVIAAAVQRGCRGVGFDIDPVRVAEATENAKKHGVENLVSIREENVFKVNLAEADVVVMYLLPWMLKDLIPSFDRCPDGTRLVSHDFEIENVVADKTVQVMDEDRDNHFIRLYITPLKKLPEKPKWKPKR